LICHSHHAPKAEGELHDMGAGWARAGCLVLVPDQLGHGERRQHPFRDAQSYPRPFRPGRQGYYFRYNSGRFRGEQGAPFCAVGSGRDRVGAGGAVLGKIVAIVPPRG
jgi:hypothetical protein